MRKPLVAIIMTKKIDPNFNPRTIQLEFKEEYTRDTLQVNIDSWVKFRHVIGAGLNSNVLKPTKKGSKQKALTKTFPDIGKSHYQAVTNLGFCKQSLLDARAYEFSNEFLFEKALYNLYFHAGCVFDALGHLLYIVLIKDSTTKLKSNNKPHLGPYRHWVDWGKIIKEIRTNKKRGFSPFFKSKQTDEIINIRNNYTHNWSIVKAKKPNGEYYWPNAVRTKRNYKWPYHQEGSKLTGDYKRHTRIVDMLNSDFNHLQSTFNDMFGKLTELLNRFEKEHKVTIK